MALFKILQGLDANKPTSLTNGYCYFTIDNNMFYVDHYNASNVLVRSPLNAQNANTLTDSSSGNVAKLVQAMSSSSLEIPSCNAIYSYLHETIIPDLEGLINLKMDKADPTGTGAFSLNRKASTTIGSYSATLGINNTASGANTFVAGSNSTANQDTAIALGEGLLASSANQVVVGKYNIEDAASKYGFIVGNGSSSARANAFTVDWQGNGVLGGTLTISEPTSTSHAATKGYVEDMVASVVQLTIIEVV